MTMPTHILLSSSQLTQQSQVVVRYAMHNLTDNVHSNISMLHFR